MVINATTGGFAVQLVGAGPTTGITVVSGERALVAWNGSDFVKVASNLVTGTATRIPFFDASGLLSSAADFVRDASGNVGIGTASPRVPGGGAIGLTLNGSTTGFVDVNTNGTRVLTLSGFGNDAFVTNPTAAGVLILQTNNTERLRIDSSGNVGIGTTTSLSPLHVFRASSSSVRIDTDAAASTTQLNFAVSGTNRWSLYRPGGSNDLRIFDNTNTIDVVTWQAGGQQINNANSVVPPTLTVNGQWNLTPTSNTNMRISYRGTDGVTRVANITLA